MAIIELDTTFSPFLGYQTDYWGSVNINGVQFTSPTDGYFSVKGAEKAWKWDIQQGMMLLGAIEQFRGREPPPFTLEMNFWEQNQYARFLDVVKLFYIDSTKLVRLPNGAISVRALTIYHPALDAIGIGQVIVEAIGAPEQVSDDHMWKASFKLREYFPPLPVPKQDFDTAPKPTGDPTDSQLRDYSSQVQFLGNRVTQMAGDFINGLNRP